MSELLTLDSVKNALVECPICTEYFHGESRTPRRMPCCNQTICELCLELYSKGRPSITCPLCCQQVSLEDGVKTLPREMVVLRFLDLLETQSNFFPSCTNCSGTAIAKCDTCRVLLCQVCLKTHHVNPATEDHITATFERARREQQARRKTVRQWHAAQQAPASDGTFSDRVDQLGKRIDELCNIHDNILKSENTAEEQINHVFDELTQELSQRRKSLLSELKCWSEKETKEVKSTIDSHQVLQFRLQKASRSRKSAQLFILEDVPQDVAFVRKGVSFVTGNLQQLSSALRETGQLRSVTYTPSDRPDNLDEASHCYAVEIEPAHLPQESSLDTPVVLESGRQPRPVICPTLDFDPTTAGDNITISGSVITNTKSEQPSLKTGCRLQAPRTILISNPFIHEGGKRYMFLVKVNFKLMQTIPLRKAIAEIAVTSNPTDMNFSQVRGLSISVASCHFHPQHKNDLCLVIETNVDRVYCKPLVPNETDTSGEMNIAVMVDYERKTIHVIDVDWAAVLVSVHTMALDKPLWTMMYLGRPEWTEVRAELVSGQEVKIDKTMMDLMSNL